MNKKERLILLLILYLIYPALLYSEVSDKNILSFFKNEIENYNTNVKFEILYSSYAKFNFIGGFADGKYKLKEFKISFIKNNVYKLNLFFEKKKGILRYYKNIKIFFWQGNNNIVFLSQKGKIRYQLPKIEIKVIKTSNGYKIIREPEILTIKIPIIYGKIYLHIKQKIFQ